MKSEKQLARIVPPAASESGLTRTQGTKVFVGDTEITGITRIQLVCEINDVWRARIDMNVQPCTDLTALSVFHHPSLWQRFKRWYRELMRPAHGYDFPR